MTMVVALRVVLIVCLVCSAQGFLAASPLCMSADLSACFSVNIGCGDLGRQVCPHTCGLCGDHRTISVPRTTTTATTTTTTTTGPTTMIRVSPRGFQEACVDNLGNGLTCSEVSDVCFSPFSTHVCRQFCQLCQPDPHAVTPEPVPTSSTTLGGCVDFVLGDKACASLPFHVCSLEHGRLLCPKFCGRCGNTGGTTVDNRCQDFIGNGLQCGQLPGICAHPLGQDVCRSACGYCTPSPDAVTSSPASTSWPSSQGGLVDRVTNGLTCAQLALDVCADTFGRVICQRHCSLATATTHSTSPVTSTPQPTTATHVTSSTVPTTPAPPCVDSGLLNCANIPGICQDPGAATVCQATCGFCTPLPTAPQPTSQNTPTLPPSTATTTTATTATTVCVDNLIVVECAKIPGICQDPLAQSLCPATCGHCTPAAGSSIAPPGSGGNGHQPTMGANCSDLVVNQWTCGALPSNVCSSTLGQLVCARHCGLCDSDPSSVSSSVTENPIPTATPATPGAAGTTPPTAAAAAATTMSIGVGGTSSASACVDAVALPCQDIPWACSALNYSRLFCPAFCGLCVNTTTGPAGNTNASAARLTTPSFLGHGDVTTVASQVNVSTTMPATHHWPSCSDHIGNGKSCADFSGFCGDSYATMLCSKSCGFCVPLVSDMGLVPPQSDPPTPSPDDCADRVTNGLSCHALPHVCDSEFGKQVCPQTCNTCGQGRNASATAPPSQLSTSPLMTSTLAAIATTPDDCADNVGLGLTCDGLAHACNDPLAPIVCRKTCGFCDCQDRIVGLTCKDLVVLHDIDPCQDELGHQVCARFCGYC